MEGKICRFRFSPIKLKTQLWNDPQYNPDVYRINKVSLQHVYNLDFLDMQTSRWDNKKLLWRDPFNLQEDRRCAVDNMKFIHIDEVTTEEYIMYKLLE